MVRTQIQITEQQAQALKALAHERGVAVAELVRQGIDRLLQDSTDVDREERKRQVIAFAGKYSSGLTDLSARHDDYLAEAYLA